MGWLCLARILIAAVPFHRWRQSLGSRDPAREETRPAISHDEEIALARRCAVQVERAAWRLPAEFKCLPKAMALSWMLRRQAVRHCVVIAARPMEDRELADALHAWVEAGDEIVIGDLPGPWHEIFRAGR